MNTVKNIKKVSLAFFVLTGLLHLGSSVLLANSYFLEQAKLINNIMDAPFILTGLLYGISSLRLNLTNPEKNYKVLDIVLLSIIILIFIAVIIINIFIPDLTSN